MHNAGNARLRGQVAAIRVTRYQIRFERRSLANLSDIVPGNLYQLSHYYSIVVPPNLNRAASSLALKTSERETHTMAVAVPFNLLLPPAAALCRPKPPEQVAGRGMFQRVQLSDSAIHKLTYHS